MPREIQEFTTLNDMHPNDLSSIADHA